ncbi:MAG: hypothetical protein DI603_18250 [Roseateles depolymerans]|uniref:Acyltransferase n=1 Tax=Roseateles depolymerans TaxID=76731 RepID=A0A2W5F8L7_9BURK|nr:MAG: hypothetical protein DI603_18250 [Roseateles depolymerans]
MSTVGSFAVDSAAMTQTRRANFNPGLQGMRGLAILLVLLNHAHVPGFGGGFVGVDIFFVISGYLIGGLLTRELEAHGRIDLWLFFARRIRRLLPASAVLLMAVLVGIRYFYSPQEQDELLSSVRAASLYAINLWFASRPTDYFGDHTEANPALHLWSLAVEEQFYLLWPLLMLAVARWTRRGACWTTLWLSGVLGVVSFAACVVLSLINYKYTFFLTPFRIWEFAAGMAVMSWSHLARGLPSRALSVLGGLALLALLLVSLLFDGRMRFPGFWAAIPVAAATALLLVVQHGSQSWVGRQLKARWIRWLGDCSYSVYLWHWPVLIAATHFVPHPDAGLIVVLLGVSIVLGHLSYRFVEQPFMHSIAQGCSARQLIAAGLMLCVLIAIAAQIARSRIQVGPEQDSFVRAARWDAVDRTGCLVSASALDQPVCEFGSRDAEVTVVLFGDSHASQWFGPLEQLAEKNHWRLVMLTKTACPSVAVRVDVYSTLADYHECTTWRERMFSRIDAMRPQLVLLASSSDYSTAPALWGAGVARTVARLQDMGAKVGYIRDTPFPGFDVPVCHARSAWRGWSLGQACTYLAADEEARIGERARAEEAAVGQRRAMFINLASAICSDPVCSTSRGDMIMFADRNHLSEAFALSLAPQLEPVLMSLLGEAASSAR